MKPNPEASALTDQDVYVYGKDGDIVFEMADGDKFVSERPKNGVDALAEFKAWLKRRA